ncbi:MAG: group II intron reverse transcriptase domain-containing protein [Clostridia bacterium]|nr:group II intron reverse transcriptase domain-containing protein [Clostridia bacterium]
MNFLTDIFGQIYDYESLYNSYLEARKNKRYRDDVLQFTDRLEENLIELQNEFIWETYKVGRYRPFFVYEPKKRLVMALQFKDRVAQWSVYRYLNPYYDRLFIDDSYACRKGKGSHAAADRLQYWLRQVSRKPGEWYYLKLDISKYFYRVDHAVLLEILSRRIKDERLMRLLATIINSEDQAFGLPAGVAPDDCPEEEWLYDVGMPIGNLTSQLFANIYLNELDQHCKHDLHLHYYIRYMDDVIILHNDKRVLHQIKDDIETLLLERLHLNLNSKTAIRPVSLGVDFVGYHIWATHRKLKKSTARRIIRTVKRLSADLGAGVIDNEYFMRRAASYKGILQHCDSYGLRRRLNEIYANHALCEKGENPLGSS